MTTSTAGLSARQSLWIIVGLCAISASTIIAELSLLKFVSYKVYYHFLHAIISVVILGLAGAGTYVYLKPKLFGQDNPDSWRRVAACAWAYAICLALSIVLFSWLPFDPYNPALPALVRLATLPLYLLLLGTPFFLAGLCISHTLAASQSPITFVYFCDLLSAAAGAALAPLLLEQLGGYGTIAVAAALAMAGSLCFQLVGASGRQMQALSLASLSGVLCLLVFYPSWAVQRYAFDIRSYKDAGFHQIFVRDFGGIAATFWNAIARIDISRTGKSSEPEFLWGISTTGAQPTLSGRFILVDSGAVTRQFKVTGPVTDQAFLGDALWGSAYVINQNVSKALVLGGGGGIDILVAKYYGVPELDVVEMNPSTFKHILHGDNDPERSYYQDRLQTDAKTRVSIYNQEARHFCVNAPAAEYDLIQASGVDQLTAIVSGALTLADNYLYTQDAVAGYARLLRPGGILSLTHWRQDPPTMALRMFLTFIEYQESIGNHHPGKNILVVSNQDRLGRQDWTDTMMKTTPFTEAEVERIRQWAKVRGCSILFDPCTTGGSVNDTNIKPSERIYQALGEATKAERQKLIDSYPLAITPVPDDRPYFYHTAKSSHLLIPSLFDSTSSYSIWQSIIFAVAVIFLPKLLKQGSELANSYLPCTIFFALCGFAFLLFEVSIIALFSIPVGGPLYALAVVLVSVLAGYGTGSLICDRFPLGQRTFLVLAGLLAVAFTGSYFFLPWLKSACIGLAQPMSIFVCASVTFALSILTGLPVSLAMKAVRAKYGAAVSWLWGVSSAFNAIAALSFPAITQATGISACLLMVAAAYGGACLLFALAGPFSNKD